MENKRNLCDELGQNFIDFSYETNSCRAFADARDGLKPGQRACLWEMYHKKYTSNKPHVKSAKIAGGVTGTWWPHGDVAIYDTFTRMSQKWINNIPEVDWHGNNGSQIIPDAAAAARYTEARLSKIVEEGMFRGIEKHIVNMIPNYSEDEEWPEVLPAIFPRLIINGCQGIGSTLANVWLPHNLQEIGQVLFNYIDNKNIDYDIIFPDFPTGGLIINKNEVSQIYKTGKGKVVLRARAEIKDNHIIFNELPYQIFLEPLIEKIKALALSNEIEGIEAVYNRSSKAGIQLDIECSIGFAPTVILQQLYKKTDLQKNYNANQWALVGKTPQFLTLKEYFDIYIRHNVECILKEVQYDLQKALNRKEIVEGLLKAIANIDDIITLIKKSESASAAKEALIKKYQFTENQAKAILAMRLSSLAKLEGIELNNEKAELDNNIQKYNNIISNESEQINILKTRLAALINKYGDARRTELTQIDIKPEEKIIEEVIPEDVVVILSQTGLIKRVPTNSFKVQRKNGKGIKTKDEAIMSTISTNTTDNLFLFTKKGKMFKIIVDDIPAGTNTSKGVHVNTLIKIDTDDEVMAITSLAYGNTAKYVVFFTKQGLMKKTLLEEYVKTKRGTGIAAIKINDNDSIVNVAFLNEEQILVVTKNGMSIRFESKFVNPVGRIAAGVKTIKLDENDEVITGLPIQSETDEVVIISTTGYGKKVSIKDFTLQNRAGKGIMIYRPSTAYGTVIGATILKKNDVTGKILLIGQPNSICVSSTDLPLLSRISFGNIILKSTIKSVVKI